MKTNLYEKLVLKFKEHRAHMEANVEDFHTGNRMADELNAIGDEIEKSDPNFIQNYERLAEEDITLGWMLGIRLREFDKDVAQRIYKKWYESNPKENFVGKYMLDSWQEEDKAS